ncbi:MAG: tetratricopeptide repeat protein [bacterium]|nr:tetratricopeptide repeat protein [bacterium]
MSTLLLLFLFLGSLGGIFFIIVRHMPAVASLKPEELVHIRHQQLKSEILLTRFQRVVITPVENFLKNIQPWGKRFGEKFYRLLHLLKALEHYYEKVSLQKQRTATNTNTITNNAEQLLLEAESLTEKGLYDDAERKYIAAIALDPKSVLAYEGLGELYFDRKDYAAARETYAYIVKLNERSAAAHARLGAIASASGNLSEAEKDYTKALELSGDLVSSHIDLGIVHQTMEKHEEALQNFLKARELEPKNPRVLDLLLATAIILGKRSLAEEMLAALAETNPENQKLEELQKRVAEIPEEIVEDKKVRRKK